MTGSMVILGLVALAPVVAVGLGAYVVRAYRRLAAIRHEVDRAWIDVDVLLRQRHHEVQALAEAIRSVGGEPGVAVGIAGRFAAVEPTPAPFARYAAEQRVNWSLWRFLKLVSFHPNLRGSDGFALVRLRLQAIDENIQDRRERYNELVTLSNAWCERFPDRLLAGLAGLHPYPPLRAVEDERRDAAPARTGGAGRPAPRRPAIGAAVRRGA